MNVLDQIPAMDLAVAKIDKRIGKAQAALWKLEDRINTLLKRAERSRRYMRELGKKRSELQTFQLGL